MSASATIAYRPFVESFMFSNLQNGTKQRKD